MITMETPWMGAEMAIVTAGTYNHQVGFQDMSRLGIQKHNGSLLTNATRHES